MARVAVPAVVGVALLVLSSRIDGATPSSASGHAGIHRRHVVVAARPLDQGSLLRRDDLRVVDADIAAMSGVVEDPQAAVGLQTSIPLDEGSPLLLAALRHPDGREDRVVALTVEDGGVAPGVRAGDIVTVLAADDGPPANRPFVYVVARVTVVAGPRPASPGPGDTSTFGAANTAKASAGTRLEVACADQSTAMRLLWAQAFAREIEVVRGAEPSGVTEAVVDGPGVAPG